MARADRRRAGGARTSRSVERAETKRWPLQRAVAPHPALALPKRTWLFPSGLFSLSRARFSTPGALSRSAAPSEAGPVRRDPPPRFSRSPTIRRRAACLSRPCRGISSSRRPRGSTARRSRWTHPRITAGTSSRCHTSPCREARRRGSLARVGPNFTPRRRTASREAFVPRPSGISSTLRGPSGKRAWGHPAPAPTSRGKRGDAGGGACRSS